MIGMLTWLMLAASPDVDRAEELYYKARYESALNALEPGCRGPETARCEKVRAFVLAALGERDKAVAALTRMLTADPLASLGEQVSPKLRTLFDEAEKIHSATVAMTLDTITLPTKDAPWELRLEPPPELELASVILHVSPEGTQNYFDVALRKRQNGWVAVFRPPSGGVGTAKYFLSLELDGGKRMSIGSRAMPKTVQVEVDGEPSASAPKADSDTQLAAQRPTATETSGLPSWGLWSIVGGATALVAGGVTLGVMLGREREPGAVEFRIQFGDGQ